MTRADVDFLLSSAHVHVSVHRADCVRIVAIVMGEVYEADSTREMPSPQ